MHADVVVVGGGIAGLACGAELSRAGLRVILVEQDAQLGGRAKSWYDRTTGDQVDIGPHILLTEYQNMLCLLEDLGTADDVLWQDDKFITFVDECCLVDIKMHRLPVPFHFLPSLLTVPHVSIHDLATNRRLMWRVARLSEARSERLDEIRAQDYLRTMGVSERFIDWFWRSACMSIMNVPLEQCSARSLLRFFRYMMSRNGYQVGFATSGLSDLFAPVAAARIRANGGLVLTGTDVSSIRELGQATDGIRLRDGTSITAHAVVCAVPPQRLQGLLPRSWLRQHTAFRNLEHFKPSPYVSSYLWFDRKLTREKFWARTWSPNNLNYDSYDLSNIREGWTERPSVIASNIVYSHRADHLTEDQIISQTLRELRDFLPDIVHANLVHYRLHQIPMAVPAPFPGAEQLRPQVNSPIVNLYLAGDWVDTGLPASMESAVRSGFLAAESVLRKFHQPQPIAKPPPAAQGIIRWVGGP